jgi:CHAT domain-containing protein
VSAGGAAHGAWQWARSWMRLLLLCAAATCSPAHAISGNDQIALAGAGQYEQLWRRLEEDQAKGPLRTRDLHALCFAYFKTKRYNKLLPCLERLDANIAAGDRRTRLFGLDDATPAVHLMRAEALLEMGQYESATVQAQRALDWYQHTSSDDQDIPINARAVQALAAAFQGRRTEAAAHAAELESIRTSGPLHGDFTSIKAMAVARVAMALGQYQRAYDAIAQDRAFAVHAFLDRLVSGALLTGRNNWAWQELPRAYMLGKALYGMGKVAEAKAGFDRLLQAPQIRDNGEINWMILYDRGRIAEDEGNPQEAIEFYRRAIEIIEAQRSTIHTEANKIGFIVDKQDLYGRIIAALARSGNAAAALEFSERSKSRALVDLLASRGAGALATGANAETAALLQEIELGEADALAQMPVSAGEGKSGYRSRVAQVVGRLRSTAPQLSTLVAVLPWSAANVQHALREDETMIEYYYSDKVFAAFVADRQSVRVVMLDARGLEQDVQALRTTLADVPQLDGAAALRQQLDQAYLPRAQALYRRLLAPILAQVHTPNLLVVAHGVLHYLPFVALHDGRQYVIERFGVRTLPSANVLRFVRDGTPGFPGPLLVFGNPDLGNQRFDLPQAEQEARRIAAAVAGTRLLLRGQATRDAFRKFAPDYRFIHFASHGEFDARQPLRSGLLLSGPDLEQGRLTAAEIYGAHLNAELVTLSGCETGLGTVEGGDDVVGLIRGFMYAGANSVIASLWEVDDTSTSALMTSLYGKLGSLNKRDALRRAQLETMKTFPHPFHWAAFYLTGGT